MALRPSDGHEIWLQWVKSATFMTVVSADDVVYAGAGGEWFCLVGAGGRIIWHNRLEGLGNGLVSFAGASPVEVAAAMAAAQAAAIAATTVAVG